MNEKFQYRTRPPSAVLKISSLLLVNECRKIPIIHEQYEYVNIFIIQIEYTANKNRQTSSHSKSWCNYSGVWNLHHGYYTKIMASRNLFRHNPVSRGTNKPIRKSDFVQCMKVEFKLLRNLNF